MKPFATLSDKQHNALMYIAEYFWAHGYQPLYTEIAAHLGIASPTARKLVIQLESRGYVNRVGKKLYLLYVPGFPHAKQFYEQVAA